MSDIHVDDRRLIVFGYEAYTDVDVIFLKGTETTYEIDPLMHKVVLGIMWGENQGCFRKSHRQKIMTQDSLIFAHPSVIAALWATEHIHADQIAQMSSKLIVSGVCVNIEGTGLYKLKLGISPSVTTGVKLVRTTHGHQKR